MKGYCLGTSIPFSIPPDDETREKVDSKQSRRNINYLCERNSDNVVKHMLWAELFLSPQKKKKKSHVEVLTPPYLRIGMYLEIGSLER